MKDDYKVSVLTDVLNAMKQDDFYLCRVKGDNTNAINLDEKAVKILIEYYSK